MEGLLCKNCFDGKEKDGSALVWVIIFGDVPLPSVEIDGKAYLIDTSKDEDGSYNAKYWDAETKKYIDLFDPRMGQYPYEIVFLTGAATGLVMTVDSVSSTIQQVIFTEAWPDGMTPEADAEYFIQAVNLNTRVDEFDQVDVLNFYNSSNITRNLFIYIQRVDFQLANF